MQSRRQALLAGAVMGLASIGGLLARPSAKAASKGLGISLEASVPKNFGPWRLVPDVSVQVVNPQTQQLLDTLYSQVLTRTYVNDKGYRIMLSMAYGDDQRGGLQAHKPEVCYPAQGFQLAKVEDGTLATAFGDIDVRRLSTSLGSRNEPVTYWLTVGDQIVRTTLDKRMAQIRLGLTGQIPDGLLFRISSIDADDGRAFAVQREFVADLLAAVPPESRRQLSGLASPGQRAAGQG